MRKVLVLFYFTLFVTFVFGQTSKTHPILKNSPFYFFSLYYGYNNDVYVSDVYTLEMERSDIYKNNIARYELVKNYLLKKGIVKELQTGIEKNYMIKDQALNEREQMIEKLKKQNYNIISFIYE